jgi:hypothetical protein
MTSPAHPIRWRRVLAVFAASAGLHYALIGWHADPPPPPPLPLPAARPATVVAELRSAPAAMPEKPAAPPVSEAGAAFLLPQVQLPSPPRKAAPARPVLPHYRASVPPSARLEFDVSRHDEGGAHATGRSGIDWHANGAEYRLSVSSDVPGSTLMAVTSEGAVGTHGMVPRTMTVERRGKARTATHFSAARGRITFSASAESIAMAPGTQDRATLPMQLAGIARAGGATAGALLQLMVGEEKDAGVVRVLVAGQEELETRMGKLAAWRFSTLPDPATYRPRIEVWLAPELQWYPVQLRSTEANGTVTTQTISSIVINE